MERIVLKVIVSLIVMALILGIRALFRQLRKPRAGKALRASGGNPVLRGLSGMYQGAVIPFDGLPVVVGRDPSAANLVYPPENRCISGRHCVLHFQGGVFTVEDLGSTNGTFVGNGKRLAAGQKQVLNPGERFYVGDPSNSFEVTFA